MSELVTIPVAHVCLSLVEYTNMNNRTESLRRDMYEEIHRRDQQIRELTDENTTLKDDLADSEAVYLSIKKEAEEQESRIKELEAELSAAKERAVTAWCTVAEKNRIIAAFEKQIGGIHAVSESTEQS